MVDWMEVMRTDTEISDNPALQGYCSLILGEGKKTIVCQLAKLAARDSGYK